MKTKIHKNIFLGLLFFVAIFSLQGTSQDIYTLKNQSIELTIDKKGNLMSLKNLQTGHNYASGKPLWRLYFDRKNEKDIEVLADDNQPLIRQEGNQILITYNNLRTSEESLLFKLSLKIILEENMVRFGSEIANNESHTVIRELQYPLVARCRIPSGHQLLTMLRGGHIYPDLEEKILSLPHTFMGPDHHFRQMGMKYPTSVASNCFALIGRDQGLYFGSHDSTFQDTWHGFRLYPDGNGDFNEIEAGLYKFPNCLSGESWSNNANVIAPYSGDWHGTSKLYRTWANTWWDHREEPLWVKQMSGFQRIILRHQYGETLFTYKDFATHVKDAGESVGINTVFPFGWWNSGMDNGYPDSYYITDPEQGGDEAWKKAIKDYKKGGGKVLLYFNGKLIDTESKYYRKGDGKKVSLKSNTGTEIVEAYRFSGPGKFTGYYNARSFVVAETKNPDWQQKLIEMADRAIELGANSVFYDQLGYGEKVGNWDLTKEFPVPDLGIIADKANALKMIHDYIDKKDKDLAIGTEHITDVTSQYVDYVHGIYHTGDWTVKDNTNFIEWFRYTFPEIIITDRNVDGIEPNIEWLTNRAVLLGLRTNVQTYRLRATIDETPHYQKYLAKVNQVKEKYCSLLLEGTYRDSEGFFLDNEEVEARSFVNGDQMAVVMTHESTETKSAQLSVPGYEYQESTGVGDASVIEGRNGTQTVILGKDGLIVLIYDRNNSSL